MQNEANLSFISAMIINLNIMLGAGIFINTAVLTKLTGGLGFLIYLLIGFCVLPLVLSISRLVYLYPSGAFYSYSKYGLGVFWGFFSSWIYFTGKLASASLMIHVFSLFIKEIIPYFKNINVLLLDLIIIVVFTFLNLKNVSLSNRIQYSFIFIKFIPITFAILSGLFFLNPGNYQFQNFIWSGVPIGISVVIYVFTGFESCCSISGALINPERNAPRVIIFSFLLVVLLISLFQFLFFGIVGMELSKAVNYLDAFPFLLKCIFVDYSLVDRLAVLFHIAIASSVLGGSYGILFSNNWNLYILAKKNHLFFSDKLRKLNKNNIPVLCVIVEGFICLLYLISTKGAQIPLQQTSAFSSTLVYTLSIISLIKLDRKKKFIPITALFICLFFLFICIKGLAEFGIKSLSLLLIFMIFGLLMYIFKRK